MIEAGFMLTLKVLFGLVTAFTKTSAMTLFCGRSAIGVVLLNTTSIAASVPVARVGGKALYHQTKRDVC